MTKTEKLSSLKTQDSSLDIPYDPILFGHNQDDGLVAVEHVEKKGSADKFLLFFRKGNEIVEQYDSFEPFVVASGNVLAGLPGEFKETSLKGKGKLNTLVSFTSWKDFQKAKSWFASETGFSPSAPGAPYLCITDPAQQHLMTSGRTMFGGMGFDELRRMQVDIECFTADGYEFCNADREEDRIIAIAICDHKGEAQVLSGVELDEKELLERFVAIVRELDPDVIEGHNIFNFDLPYIEKRAKRHGVKFAIGRNGSVPKKRPSRLSIAERSISYQRYDVFGRHIVDTLFLVQAYDVVHRELSGYGLKEVAIHFGMASKTRTYIEGSKIAAEFKRNPGRVMKYVADDVIETRKLSDLLSKSSFVQAQIFPYSYQNTCVRGNATRINAIILREYLRQSHSVPLPDMAHEFAGGYTDLFVEGIIKDVHHCDVRSLYPSLMLAQNLAPRNDQLNVFLKMLEVLKTFRLEAKAKMQKCGSESEKVFFDALQSTFKILINSFYGYLGFTQGNFNDFDAAEKVTSEGRKLLKAMISWLKKHGADPIEIDTDGIYFVPPPGKAKGKKMEKFQNDFEKILPKGIEVEFDGQYKAMYSYKMKNYALLTYDGEVIIKGAALKSRGLEPFQREFLGEIIRLKLEGKEKNILKLKEEYIKAIKDRTWPIEKLATTKNLVDAPATYSAKRAKGKTPKRAVYELALKSGRDYRAGDQLSYYVTGEKKSIAVNENSNVVSEWNPKKRDENVAYYLAKLEALYKKFGEEDMQQELGL